MSNPFYSANLKSRQITTYRFKFVHWGRREAVTVYYFHMTTIICFHRALEISSFKGLPEKSIFVSTNGMTSENPKSLLKVIGREDE